MKRLALLIAFTISLAGCSPADQPTTGSNDNAVADAANTVYTNGKIYTVDEAQPWTEAVAIKDGAFVVVGSNADVAAVTSDATQVIDLAGAFAMPGLIDIHTHPSMSMAFRVFCELPGTFYNPTDDMTVEALKKCIGEYPDGRRRFDPGDNGGVHCRI
jgi:predicted amidohydrolase YtcJ